MLELNKIHHSDCLELMKQIPDKSIDMILCDLPYGTTACSWDTIIPFDKLWEQYERVIKENGAIVLFGSEPFSTILRVSNLSNYKYDWYWDKRFAGNFVQAKRMPLKVCENIMVFAYGGKLPNYYPQKEKRDKPIKKGGNKQSSAIPIAITENSKQFGKKEKVYDDKNPTTLLQFNCRDGRGLHPTQKPVALLEYLIKTYTNEGDIVLDNCIGSGTTAIAAINTNRQFIGIEKEEKYVEIARKRILELK